MCKKVRLKQLKSSAYAGVTLMKKAMKGEGEVKQVVGEVPAGDCLSLVEQSLRYLDDMVAGCMNTKVGVNVIESFCLCVVFMCENGVMFA